MVICCCRYKLGYLSTNVLKESKKVAQTTKMAVGGAGSKCIRLMKWWHLTGVVTVKEKRNWNQSI